MQEECDSVYPNHDSKETVQNDFYEKRSTIDEKSQLFLIYFSDV